MGKLINRIPGSSLLISSLPSSALRSIVESLGKPRDVNKRSQSLASQLGKLDIKRHSPTCSILYIYSMSVQWQGRTPTTSQRQKAHHFQQCLISNSQHRESLSCCRNQPVIKQLGLICYTFLKELATEISLFLTTIFQKSSDTGTVPKGWKTPAWL